MFSLIRRLFFSTGINPPVPASKLDPTEVCDDCGATQGQLHDLFCLRERCPFCGGQLASCDCIQNVLKLTIEETKTVEECVDDTTEPLCTIMRRWRAALEQKGRIPFHGRKLEPTVDDLLRMAGKGEMEAVEKLLAIGVPVDATNEVSHTALKSAAWNGQLEMMRLLIERGANVNHRNADGFSALHCAVGSPAYDLQRQVECVRLLLEHGAEVNARKESGGTPLMGAAWFGAGPSVDLLLAAGADPTVQDDKGRTAADLAERRGHAQIAAKLRAQ